MGVMSKGYMSFVKVLEVAIGLLLLLPKTRALALILIAPITVNILCFELFIAQQPGIGVALVLLNVLGLYFNKEKYSSILS
jgi:putative oxidoreductase